MINIKKFFRLNHFVSELDQFLNSFDEKNPILSTSQRKERDKYAKINKLRDVPCPPVSTNKFWKQF